jgi:hypothetical protein
MVGLAFPRRTQSRPAATSLGVTLATSVRVLRSVPELADHYSARLASQILTTFTRYRQGYCRHGLLFFGYQSMPLLRLHAARILLNRSGVFCETPTTETGRAAWGRRRCIPKPSCSEGLRTRRSCLPAVAPLPCSARRRRSVYLSAAHCDFSLLYRTLASWLPPHFRDIPLIRGGSSRGDQLKLLNNNAYPALHPLGNCSLCMSRLEARHQQ